MREEDQRSVRRIVQELPLELREVLVLRELEGLSYKEIAALAGIPLGRSCPAWPVPASGCNNVWVASRTGGS